MSLTFQPHSPKERSGLGIMKNTKPETQGSLNKSVLGTINVSETKITTPSIPTKVKNTKQESKINELTKLVQMLIDEKNSSSSKSLRPKPIQKPQHKCKLYHYSNHSTDDCYRILHCMIYKREDHRTSDHEMYTASLKRSENYKAQPYQYASPSKQILKAKAKPFPPCIHYGFNDHRPDDSRNYTKNFQNFSSPYTPKENGVAERKNRTLIEADRTMLNGLVLSKNLRTKADEQIITQSTKGLSGQNTKILVSIIESSVLDVSQSNISNQASTSSHPVTQDRWSKDQHNKLMNIIGDPSEGILTRSMAAKLTDALASKCLFADFLSKIKPKRVSDALKHSG
ncbi:retrovirus-related pol polyprotein from transposon TNT 1-94 [Tanacetum coccineum]